MSMIDKSIQCIC